MFRDVCNLHQKALLVADYLNAQSTLKFLVERFNSFYLSPKRKFTKGMTIIAQQIIMGYYTLDYKKVEGNGDWPNEKTLKTYTDNYDKIESDDEGNDIIFEGAKKFDEEVVKAKKEKGITTISND
jgi:hypothetical protein